MKFYIATGLKNAAQHTVLRHVLEAAGHVCTYDWTEHGSVRNEGPERCSEVAVAELRGVEQADVVFVLFPGGRGTHSEMGAALVIKKKVFAHAETDELFQADERTCAFYHHPLCTLTHGADMLPLLSAFLAWEKNR